MSASGNGMGGDDDTVYPQSFDEPNNHIAGD